MENQVQVSYRTPNVQNYNRSIPRHIIMKVPNIQNKDRISKVVRKKSDCIQRETNTNMSRFFNPDPKS